MDYQQIESAKQAVKQHTAASDPRIGIVLGSGLGHFADAFSEKTVVEYDCIPGFATSSVSGHAGRLVLGTCGGVSAIAMQGRLHAYEGYSIDQVVLPTRVLVACGCDTLVITNAAGGIRGDLVPGDLVLITDHINLQGRNPLEGTNDQRLGPRFPDMTEAYDARLRNHALSIANKLGIDLKKGIYCAVNGPSYETPAEIKMLSTLGADLVGMSTVPEVIAANHMGARVLGISCVTNKAAGLGGKLSHDEVKETAERTKDTFSNLLESIVRHLGATECRA